jgi:restriction system protein
MKSYFRVILGAKSVFAKECYDGSQEVRGIIIALEDDLRIKRALSVTNIIEFYRYQVSFKLFKHNE